jgi:hypothetical protein
MASVLELVEWFNSVDATYRAGLREINEMNFARFDAKLEERLAKFDVRFAQVDTRFAQVGARFDQVDARFAAFERRIDERFAAFEDRIGRTLAERLGAFESKMTWWMVGFCTTHVVALAGLVYAILQRH